MVKPLDIVLGHDIEPKRQAAIDAVKQFVPDDESLEFWDRVERVQNVCNGTTLSESAVADALDIVSHHMWPEGHYGHMTIPDSGIDPLISSIAARLAGK